MTQTQDTPSPLPIENAELRYLLDCAKEAEKVLRFAFNDVFSKEVVITLCVDPWGVLEDLADSIRVAEPIVNREPAYAAMKEALKEALAFQNDDTKCLAGYIQHAPDDFEQEECPDRRCYEHGCMVERVNRWRHALAMAEGKQ